MVWIARSGPEPPRNSQMSPVRVTSSASFRDTLWLPMLALTPAA